MFLNPNTLAHNADPSSRSIINILHDHTPASHSLLYPRSKSRRVLTKVQKNPESAEEISTIEKNGQSAQETLMQIIVKPWSQRSVQVTHSNLKPQRRINIT
jgi:hypothetical protein